jgi:hypothetical protein
MLLGGRAADLVRPPAVAAAALVAQAHPVISSTKEK